MYTKSNNLKHVTTSFFRLLCKKPSRDCKRVLLPGYESNYLGIR